jgi:hypothetical protein
MLRIGRGASRRDIARAFRDGDGLVVTYDDVLSADDVREAVAGVAAAGHPQEARPLLAWLASHPSTPDDVLLELAERAPREVLVALAMNPRTPRKLQRSLLDSSDEDVASYAAKTFKA